MPAMHTKKSHLGNRLPRKKRVQRKKNWAVQVKYKPEFCQQLIEHMADGYSFESFATIAGVCRRTLYNWRDGTETTPPFDEFKEAANRGFDASLLYWERTGRAGMFGKIKNFNATVWIFTMKNMHGWRDRHDTEITATQPITVKFIKHFSESEDGNE